jgi:hypothetical protein
MGAAGYIFGGRLRSSEAATGGGGAQRPVRSGLKPKMTGARSARARTRGQNPLVIKESSPGTVNIIVVRTEKNYLINFCKINLFLGSAKI